MELVVAGDPIDGRAGAADAAAAPAPRRNLKPANSIAFMIVRVSGTSYFLPMM